MSEIRICASDQLVDGGDGVRFEASIGGRTEPAFVVRFDGQVYAYVNRCAHIGYEMDWQPGKFFDADGLRLVCAVHGWSYEPDTGRAPGGYAALTRLPVEEREGAVFLKSFEP